MLKKILINKAVLRRLLALLPQVNPRLRCLIRHSKGSLTFLIASLSRTLIFLFCIMPAPVPAQDLPVRVETDAKLEYNKGIGMTFDYLKQYEASISMFKELLERKPDDYDAIYRAALVSYKMNLPEQAKEYLAKLPVSNPLYYKGQELARKMGKDIQTIKTSTPQEDEIPAENPAPQGTFAGNFYYENLPSPTGIVVDSVGYLYVANYSDNLIYRITPTGEKMVYLKTPKLNGPIGLAMDEVGNLYIANYNNNSVLKLSSSHQLTTLIENIEKPYYLYVNGGYLFISSQGTNTVVRYKI